MPNLVRTTPQDRYFQAMTFPEMDVQRGDDQIMMVMLLIDQAGCQLPGVVIINESDYGHLFALGPLCLLADEPIADEVADRFAARRIALGGIPLVEGFQQGIFQRDRNSSQLVHTTAAFRPNPVITCGSC